MQAPLMAATSGFDVRHSCTQSTAERSTAVGPRAPCPRPRGELGADVGAGAETPPGPGDHDRADGGVVVGGGDDLGHLAQHLRRPGVQPLGTVERDAHDVADLLHQDLLELCHGRTVREIGSAALGSPR